MKNECYIVRDLLPSYIDQLCSEESKQFIEQHITRCDSCSRVLHQMKDEFDVVEQVEVPVRIEQKKPFEKVSKFLKAQLDFAKFLKGSFVLSLLATLVLLVFAFVNLAEWQENRLEEQRVDQQQEDIMNKTFAALSTPSAPDENALQAVYDQYQNELQHIAVFKAEAVQDAEDADSWQKGPSTRFPIDYAKASIIIGENGKITESIIPNDYDIGTMIMAKGGWVVQFEYKESYLATVENAFQIKHFSPKFWELFILPIAAIIITMFVLGNWQYQKRIMKPMKNLVN